MPQPIEEWSQPQRRPKRHPRIMAAWFRMNSEERLGSSNTKFPDLMAFSVCAIAVIGGGSAWMCSSKDCSYFQMIVEEREDIGKPLIGYFQACPRCQCEKPILKGFWSAYIGASDHTEFEELAQNSVMKYGNKLEPKIVQAMFPQLFDEEGELEVPIYHAGGDRVTTELVWRR